MRLNRFDRICCSFAFPIVLVILAFGVMGTASGIRLSLDIPPPGIAGLQTFINLGVPPQLSVLPILIGWGMLKSILVAWNDSEQNNVLVGISDDETDESTNQSKG